MYYIHCPRAYNINMKNITIIMKLHTTKNIFNKLIYNSIITIAIKELNNHTVIFEWNEDNLYKAKCKKFTLFIMNET